MQAELQKDTTPFRVPDRTLATPVDPEERSRRAT